MSSDSPLVSQHALLRALPETSRNRLLSCLELIEMPIGELPLSIRGQDVIYLPLNCVLANEIVDEHGDSAFQAFASGMHIFGLQRTIVPSANQRLTVIGKGHAFRGRREEVYGVLMELEIDNLFQIATLRGMIELNSRNAICAQSHYLPARIARLLVEAHHAFGNGRDITINQKLLGTFLGTRRETVSEVLKLYDRENLISLHRQRITINNIVELKRKACQCWESSVKTTTHYQNTFLSKLKIVFSSFPLAEIYVHNSVTLSLL